MQFADYLSKDNILLKQSASGIKDAVRHMVDVIMCSRSARHKNTVKNSVIQREAALMTVLSGGFALPHAQTNRVETLSMAAMTLAPQNTIRMESKEDVKIIFLIIYPGTERGTYLQLLEYICRLCIEPDYGDALLAADSKEHFYQLLNQFQSETQPVAFIPKILAEHSQKWRTL